MSALRFFKYASGPLFVALYLGLGALLAKAHDGTHEMVVEIIRFEYVAQETFDLQPGDTVVFINRDFAPHTATATDESWDSGELKKDERWEIIVTEGMTLDYFCRYHVTMTATLPTES